jgi:anthranilate synthase component 1
MTIVSTPDLTTSAPVARDRSDRSVVLEIEPSLDLLALHRISPDRYPVLLESTGGSPALGRFDILMAFPAETLTLDARWQLTGPGAGGESADFLRALDAWWAAEACRTHAPAGLPFHGGWFLFLGYELARQIEPSLGLESELRHPVATAVRIPAAVVRDHGTGRCLAVAEEGKVALLRDIAADVRRLVRLPGSGRWDVPAQLVTANSVVEDDPALFLRGVERVQQHIAAGDVYQANISRRWCGRLAGHATGWMLYERLRRSNPAPFSGLATFGGLQILSSSPERLVRVRDGRVETRPIAGTRARQQHAGPESAWLAGLLANPKERAEHVMLLDLERNDLGRVCRAGSVRVDEFMSIESYAHVHHIVSNVSGELRPGIRPGDVLRAVFPGGTITGCPKVRCMSIIRELETRPRGAYTGAMGYLNRDGSCDLNILIRSMAVDGDCLSFSAGSGIVADSIPERELEETRAKAKGLLLSLEAPGGP